MKPGYYILRTNDACWVEIFSKGRYEFHIVGTKATCFKSEDKALDAMRRYAVEWPKDHFQLVRIDSPNIQL